MKKLKITISNVLLAMMFLMAGILSTYGQIHLEGNYADGEGGAGWDADGSGPEPYGNGHGDVFYYLASRDYIDPGYASGAHCLSNMSGFEAFEQALADNGFTPEQATFRMDLMSLGEDIQGVDWFDIGNMHYGNWGPLVINIDLDGEPMIYGTVNYALCYHGPSTGYNWFAESAYFRVHDLSGISSPEVKIVAQAFIQDMDGMELKLSMRTYYAGVDLTGNGRSGGYYNMTGTFEKGLPTFPFQGQYADNEGTAAWNADGTGPEPYGNGHGAVVYYSASVDYDGINPDPDACLAHGIEGSDGFFNTLLQLQYRGLEVSNLKIKMGLCSLGPDIYGEDWGVENGYDWLNEYNNKFTFEINGEPILEVLLDTNKMVFINPGSMIWSTETTVGKVYNISENASEDAQFVAQSFLKDLGSHYLMIDVSNLRYVGPFSDNNGRSGVYYEIDAAEILGVHEQATFVPESSVYGIWTLAGSPYYVDGHLTVENGKTLTIQPGVKVAIRGPYHINVEGCLYAEGTPGQTITFTHSNPIVWWDGFGYGSTSDTNEVSVFDHCLFQYGKAQGNGAEYSGGIFAIRDNDNIQILNSTFRNNKADIDDLNYFACGGAIALWNSSPLIRKCIFHDNYALDFGGAIFVYLGSNPIISNCLFYNNESNYGGVLAYYSQSNGILINNTISDNVAIHGGAFYFYSESNPQIINNIIWGNSADYGSQVYFASMSLCYPGFYYNNIEGGIEGFYGGSTLEYLFNISEDPLFTGEPAETPYYILAGSPCIDMGTPDTSGWYYPDYLPEICLGGNPRVVNDRIDIGACEYFPTGILEAVVSSQPVTVYPNPFIDRLDIRLVLSGQERVSLQIYNTTGSLVARTDYGELSAGNYVKTWNAASLPDGIYLVRILIGSEILTRKVVKAD